jgi:hypothetical protein
MAHFYLLDENKKHYEVSLEQSLKLYEDFDMKITKQTRVNDDIRVSTVFLGFNHAPLFDNNGKRIINGTPVLWETMIFGGEHDQYQERYTSHEDALAGHQRALDLVNESITVEIK